MILSAFILHQIYQKMSPTKCLRCPHISGSQMSSRTRISILRCPKLGTENIVAFSRVLKGPRVPKRLPQLGLVLRGTVGSTRFHPRDLKVILTTLSEPRNSHRLWLSVLFERQFRNQSYMVASCFGFVLAQGWSIYINIPYPQNSKPTPIPQFHFDCWGRGYLHCWVGCICGVGQRWAGALPCCRGCRGCELQEGFKP